MKVISLFGKKNVGKTTTICFAYKMLKERGYTQGDKKGRNRFKYLDQNSKDFLDVLNKDGQIVGIVSQGDYAIDENSVKEYLRIFKEDCGCDIAICACNTSGSLKKQKAVFAYCPDVLILDKCPSEKDELQYDENMKDANTLLDMLEKNITSIP